VENSGCGIEVRDAVAALLGQLTGSDQPAAVSTPTVVGSTHVADEVRAALGVGDLQPTIDQLRAARTMCRECGQRISKGSAAELVLERDLSSGTLYVRATHPGCLTSQIIDGIALTMPIPVTEAECITWHAITAAVIVDCKLGLTIETDGKVIDQFFTDLRSVGFTDLRLQDLDTPFPPLGDQYTAPALTAQIAGSVLHIELDRASVYGPIDLGFYAKWYALLRRGHLLVIFGRNLPGSYADDPVPLRRAVRHGAAVGALLPVTIVPPRPNGPCVCSPATGKKYKDCCGIAKPLLNLSPTFVSRRV
jgi:hypothetical protein